MGGSQHSIESDPFISANSPEPFQGSSRKGKDTQGDLITATIAKCREDIMALWADPVVQAILSGSRRVQDFPWFVSYS